MQKQYGDPYARGQQSKKTFYFRHHATPKIILVSQLGVPIMAKRQSRIAPNAVGNPFSSNAFVRNHLPMCKDVWAEKC